MKYSPFKHQFPSVMLKERILASAFQQFSDEGYVATNPDTITKPLGISRVAFYTYFKSKNDILLHLANELFEELSGLLKDKKAQKAWLNADTVASFEEPLNYIIDIILNYNGLFRAFIQGMMGDDELLSYYSKITERFAGMFRFKIVSLQRTGRYNGCSASLLSQLMVNTFFMSVFLHAIGIIEGDKKSLGETVSVLFFSALNMNEKNLSLIDRSQTIGDKGRSTRRLILEAARNEYEKNKSKRISVSRIADRAGLSRGTVYQYFKNKEELEKGIAQEFSGFLYNADILQSEKSGKGGTPEIQDKDAPVIDKGLLTRKSIISAAIQEFAEHGYFESTMENIANRAGLSRSTLYLYFSKKDELIVAIISTMLSNLTPQKGRDLLDGYDTRNMDSTYRIIRMVVDAYENFSASNWAILQGSFHSRELFRNFKSLHDLFGDALQVKIEEIIKEELCLPVDAYVAARVIMTCLSFSATMRNAGIIKCTKNEMTLNLTKFLFPFLNFNAGMTPTAARHKKGKK